ncbi:MAG TPA: hypothetical protein VKV26_15235 [Dehalococcoidia bacterium]|nr:hypothetical protein [Dehalococcoidia bacterium]
MASDAAGDANGGGAPGMLPWQRRLSEHLAGLSAAQTEALHADAVSRLDRAARARPLTLAETATLSALAAYLAPRVARRSDGKPAIDEAVLFGLMAGYQLAIGEQSPLEPDPFA